ncbi:hypothetical protein Vretimale_1089 [Volvox reticuliferus]|nr:hypothetical protein Vretifemale_10320 [Volvox reticuliferus]GIL95079.1 hypothetical protein Vretimale_1089 [Volvox reticuliferus]
MGRLTSRLRPFGANSPGSSGIGSVGGIGLPPSTPSSCCDFSQQSQPCTQAQTFAPRQKWQELEGPTGDSTKQLLFGMIKTLQGRPTEDEESSSFGPTAVGQRPGLPFMNYGSQVPGNTGISPQTASPPAAALTTTGRSLDTCTELNHAPVLQVMQANNVLLHANVEGSTPVTAASPPLTRKAIASPHSVARHVPGGVVEGTSVEVGSRPAAAVAAAPVRHLLDM